MQSSQVTYPEQLLSCNGESSHKATKDSRPNQQLPKEVDKKKAMSLAASWYVAMPSKALGKKLKAVELFGQPLVAWRDQQGKPVIMERYCSHLGASLAIGELVDGCIQCPFHHWRYDRSGNCVFVPEVNHIPPKARQVTYVTTERYGYVWVWYGSQNPLFPLPEFPPAEDERHNYMPWRIELEAATTARQVLENMYDYYHLVAVHGMRLAGSVEFTLLDPAKEINLPIQQEAWFGALIEAKIKRYNGLIGAIAGVLGLKAETFASRLDSCPGVNLVTGFVNGEERFRVLDVMTPVSANKTIWHALLMVKKSGKFWLDIPYYLVLGSQSKVSAVQDVKVFNTMNQDKEGAYIKHDRGVLKYRDFYQSWVDKVEVN
ncbi:Rieske 2Fe-2S domain-containing protein [Brasilonema sp. UFV-L1]|uniref:Rieske 2Fe-2S domain-containing protein n=1 Tax=Brasilonema sp. UFV-L1 TaxID=2234130 RepID=UPI00145F80E5|nr:Rieske 2Fe-2S domain-containing protein [Brasilonema sp. UFV-L1]NMG08665.1 aromatic ring-hydroxylating dioxygenase subunit alpha [Brasilonema sp. UFV-L1]